MRVLHFTKTYYPDTFGGVEQVINQICRGVKRFGVVSDVLALSRNAKNEKLSFEGHDVYQANLDFHFAATGFSLSSFRMFSKLAEEADVIHYHYPWPFMDVVHFASKVNKPAVVTYHSDIVRQKNLLKLYRPLKQRFLSSVTRIVATSPDYVASSDVLGRYSDKVSVIPIGLDKASYLRASPERIADWRNRVGEKFYLFVGVLRYYKGLHILLDAARDTDFPIVIVGAGPVERELKAQASRLGLGNVHFMGRVSEEDKAALLELCYGVVLPSHLRSEAFGISLLEGAMYGKPMICSQIGTGTTFINVHGETGVVFPPNDANALRDAMRYLWNHPAEARRMGQRAEQRYWERFTAREMAAEYAALYRELTALPGLRKRAA